MLTIGSRNRLWLAGLALASGVFLGCGGDDEGEVTEPVDQTGTIEITTITAGEFPDTNGYDLAINGSPPQPLAINGRETIAGLAPTTYLLQVSDVAPNCSVTGDDAVTVLLRGADTARVTFDVVCTSGPGIVGVRGPETVTFARAGGLADTATLAFDWVDPDGDIDSLVLTLVSDPSQALGLPGDQVTFDPGYSGLTSGTFTMIPGCFNVIACSFGPGSVTVGLTLVDSQGQRSGRAEYSFEIAEPR
jgi:hypothetical protein